MNKLNIRGFIPIIFILIAVLSSTALSGVGYGIYKYRQTAKENDGLKEQIELQKDQQIQDLQEQVDLLQNETGTSVGKTTTVQDSTDSVNIAPPIVPQPHTSQESIETKSNSITECKQRVTEDYTSRVKVVESVRITICLNSDRNGNDLSACMDSVDKSVAELGDMHEDWLRTCDYKSDFIP